MRFACRANCADCTPAVLQLYCRCVGLFVYEITAWCRCNGMLVDAAGRPVGRGRPCSLVLWRPRLLPLLWPWLPLLRLHPQAISSCFFPSSCFRGPGALLGKE